MKTEFITYEQALALKELGFDEDCFGWYGRDRFFYEGKMTIYQGLLLAPLKQQVFRWLRENYGLIGIITHDFLLTNQFFYQITSTTNYSSYISEGEYCPYEEAEKECIDKLIELAK